MAKKDKVEFINRTQGYLGAIQINRKGDEVAVAVRAGDSVFLDEEEQRLTKQAHSRPDGNPFEPREITFHDLKTHAVTEVKTVAPLERVQETGAAATPAGSAARGRSAPHEEVGTPDAPRRTRRRGRAPAAAG